MKANLKNAQTGAIKQVKVGFSWTVFFFGFFVPLLRGDFIWALIMFVISLAASFIMPSTAFVVGIVFSFMYNSIYVKGLVKKGFEPASEADRDILNSKGYLA